MVGDRRTYDILLELLDPKLVKFQFQVSTIRQGSTQLNFTKYPGRFISLHAQDLSEDTKRIRQFGKGIVDWKKVFTAARRAGSRTTSWNESGPDAGQRAVSPRSESLIPTAMTRTVLRAVSHPGTMLATGARRWQLLQR